MDTDQIVNFFLGQGLVNLFFKSFAILSAVLYFVYALIVFRQTQIMNKTVTTRGAAIFTLISLLQLIFSILLIVLAIAVL